MACFSKLHIVGIASTLIFNMQLSLAAEIIFEENFDMQPDWKTSVEYAELEGLDLPIGWDFGRTSELWHPDFGDNGSQPSMMVNGHDPAYVFGGSGKAFISYSESYNNVSSNGFASDGFITKVIQPTDEVYVQFRIKFQPGFAPGLTTRSDMIKLFRILSYDGQGERSQFFSQGNSAPIYIYDWGSNRYGVRHIHSFRCDSQEDNYYCVDPVIGDAPRAIHNGAISANYSSDLKNLHTQPFLPDLTQENALLPLDGTITHDQVFGEKWHLLAFYVKLNSAPNIQDGVLKHWFNNQLIIDMKEIPWIGLNGDMSAKWNSISFGGNDYFHFNLDENAPLSDRERWYSIDDIKIFNTIPNADSSEVNNFPLEGDIDHINHFGLSIEQAHNVDVSFDFETINGTAIAGQDFIASSGVATISAGQLNTSVPITIIGDNIDENDEYFYLKISNPQGIQLPAGTKELIVPRYIKNDDSPL